MTAAHGDDLHSGLQEERGHLHRRGQHAAGVVAQIDHQPGQTVAAQFLDGRFHFLRGLLVEAVDADVADAGADEKGAVHAGRLHFLRRQREVQQARNARTAHVQARLPLARLFQQLRKLIGIELPDDVAVDRQNFVARRESRLLRWRARQRLKHDHAPGQNRHHAAESLGGGGLHALELLELLGIEEDRMRIQLAQHRGDGAGVHGLFGIDGVGRILRGDGVGADDAAELLVEIVLRPEKRGGTE